ncbi:hypothetical protein D3871_12365 [Noviherbaspirillum saxi]|uniref:Uncharacterized protein n=1 Tax=Noviherbaspirillum saxi TaxID=2320863 RepID=A0A3A3FV60_9BURK|nr:hypothetical protein D3871_12365 [Noviherbaspirillum saxi]
MKSAAEQGAQQLWTRIGISLQLMPIRILCIHYAIAAVVLFETAQANGPRIEHRTSLLTHGSSASAPRVPSRTVIEPGAAATSWSLRDCSFVGDAEFVI